MLYNQFILDLSEDSRNGYYEEEAQRFGIS